MDGKSKDIKKEQVEKIKQLFPEAVSKGDVWKQEITMENEISLDKSRE